MTLLQLRTRVRERLDDTNAPYLWSDDELNFEINRAVNEACLRNNNLITDSETASVCELSLLVGTNSYAISDKILKIWRIKLPSALKPIMALGYKAFDDSLEQDWEVRDGTPTGFALDIQQRKIVLSHKPIVAETATMVVARLPLVDLSDDSDVPEMDEQWHYDLRDFACYAALLKRDVDAEAMSQGLRYLANFNSVFGERKDHEHGLKSYPRRSVARFV